MCDLFNSNQTSTVQTKLPGYVDDAYQNLFSRANRVSNTPYDPATERRVAGFSFPQQQAFTKTQATQGIANPYIQSAYDAATRGGAAFDPNSAQGFMNPYQRSVIDATLANIRQNNQLQQQDVLGNATAAGALGGDRVKVAQAELARNQNLATNQTLAGLNAANYEQAMRNAINVDAGNSGRAFQAAGAFSGLGGQAQESSYKDAAALLGIGGQQQGLNQARMDAETANAQQRYQDDFNKTKWLAGITQGLGSTAGGTTTSTQPGPSPFSQLLGLGVTALGAAGGFPALGGLAGGLTGGWGAQTVPSSNALAGLFADGGRVAPQGDRMDDLLSKVSRASGVIGQIKRASGGPVYEADDELFNALIQQESGGNPNAVNAKSGAVGLGQVMPATARDPGFGVAPLQDPFDPVENARFSRDYLNALLKRYGGDKDAALAAYNWGPGNADKWVAGGKSGPIPGETRNYIDSINAMIGGGGAGGSLPPASGGPSAAPEMTAGLGAAAPAGGGGIGGSDGGMNIPLMAAGLGILASNSPFPGVAIGEGGLQGLNALLGQRKAKAEARRLAEEADLARQKLGIESNLAQQKLGIQRGLARQKLGIESGQTKQSGTDDPDEIARQKAYGQEKGKKEAEAPAVRARVRSALSKAQKIVDDALRLKDHSGLPAAVGPQSALLPTVWEDTANFETDLEAMKTQIFVAAINEMRELSKAGGALGAVTEREIEKMENSIRNLQLRQGEGNMRQNLELLAKDFQDSIDRIKKAYEDEYGSDGGAATGSAPAASGGKLKFNLQTGDFE